MDFTTTRDDLIAALSRAAAIAEKRSTTPILSSALIEATPNGLTVSATDKALTYVGIHAATVTQPGSVALAADDALNVAKSLPAGAPVSVRLLDNFRVEIRAGKTVFKLNGLDAANFPKPPTVKDARTLSIAAADLRRVLDQVLYAVAPEDNRYGLNGAHVEEIGEAVRFVGTDGNRLSWSEAAFSGELGIGRKSLLPRKAMSEIRRLLDGYEGTADLSFGDRAAIFTVPGVTLHLRLLEADFPDYRQVLPSSFKRKITVEREELTAAIKRVAIFAKDGANTVRCEFTKDGGLVLSARKLDAGDAREEIPTEITGDPITMGFNSRFLLDALGSLGNKTVVLNLGDALSPCVVVDPEDRRVQCVVMPVRLDA